MGWMRLSGLEDFKDGKMNKETNLFKSNPTFFKLWLSQLLASFGDSFYDVAIVWHLIETTGSALLAGGIAISGTIGRLIGSSYIAQKVDLWCTRKVMLVTAVLRGIMLLVVVGLISYVAVPLIVFYIISFTTVFLNACSSAAQRKSISEVVEKAQLVNANASFGVSFSFVQITSWALGGIVVAVFGVVFALLINAGTTLLSALLIWVAKWKSVTSLQVEDNKAQIAEGLRLIRNAKNKVQLIVIVEVACIFLLGFYWAAFPLLIDEISNAIGYGMQGAAFGVGCLITSIYLARSRKLKKLGLAYVFGIIFYAIGVIVSAAIPHIAVFIFGVFISGLGNSFWSTGRQTIFHLSIPTEDVGKVFAIFDLLTSLFLIPAWILGGYLADTFSPTLVMMGVGVTMFVILMITLQNKPLRRVEAVSEAKVA